MTNPLLNVQLIAHTPNPEQVIAAAAKLCYSPSNVCEIMQKQTPEQAEKFIEMLMSMWHESPLEHVTFTFGIEGISRITETQLVRHRIASYSVQSGRYVKRGNPDFVTPQLIQETPEALAIYEAALQDTVKTYHDLTNTLMNQQIKDYCDQKGLEPMTWEQFYDYEFEMTGKRKQYSKFEKIAIENARYIYPQALATKLVVTMNVRSLMNFMKHRTCRRAQNEIQEMAWAMAVEIQKVMPSIGSRLCPTCTFGKCGEGHLSCGKPVKVLPWETPTQA